MKTKKNTEKVEQAPLENSILVGHISKAKQAFERIDEYEKLITALPDLLTAYAIQVKQLCASIDIARGTFYNRVKAKDFSPTELRKVYKFIENYIKTQNSIPSAPEKAPQTVEPLKTPHNAPKLQNEPLPLITIESSVEHAKTATNDLPASLTTQPSENTPPPRIDITKRWLESSTNINGKNTN